MSRTVILTEKSSVADTVAKVLNLNVKRNGYYENKDGSMVCTWLQGHILETKKPDDINPEWKTWKLDVLPFDIDTDKEMKIKANLKGQYKIVKDLLTSKETTSIISYPDAEIEGVKIQFELFDYIKNKKPVKIVWAKDYTEKTIIKAFNNLLEVKDIEGKYDRGKARVYLDYHLGMNLSRGATLTFGNGNLIRFGRCITPLLSLLVQREKEIESFKSVPYYEISSVYDSFAGTLINGDKKEVKRFNAKDEAEELVNGLGKSGIVKSCKNEEKQTIAPKLFSLQSLQSHLGSKYGISPDKTLEICQSLYEKALTTYPRTDSEFITKNQWNEIQEYLDAAKGFAEYKDIVDGIKVDVSKPDKNYVNDAKVTDHTAITITSNEKLADEYAKLDDLEKKVFDEILKRFLSIFMPPYKYSSTEIIVEVDGSQFISKGNVPLSLGWKELYKDSADDKEADRLPDLKEGQSIEITEFKILDKQTTAPIRYGISNITNLEKKYKIGTAATQASFIPKLVQSGYVEVKKGKYYATALGKQYIESLSAVPELSSPNLATAFEEKLESIETGELSLNEFKAEMVEKQKELIEKFKTADKLEKKEGVGAGTGSGSKSLGVCPLCGKEVVENKKGYGCTGWKDGCKFTVWKTIAGKDITTTQAKELIEKGKTSKIIKGFKKKDGGTFNAYLIRKEDGSIGFEFK